MRTRPYLAKDNVGEPCTCLECQAADVTHLRIVRVPGDEVISTPHWLHGDALKRWYEARDEAYRQLRHVNARGFGGGS